MAFLSLKQKHHLNKPIIIRLSQSPIDVVGKKNPYYDKIEFTIKAVNIGKEYYCAPKKDMKPFKINIDQEFDFVMTETLFGKINDFEKDELVWIEMLPNAKGGIKWNIAKSTEADIKNLTNHLTEDPVKKDRDLEIKWGMAFNNATKLIAQTTTSTNHKDMVEEIKRIIAPMFQIACGMEKTIEFINNGNKKVKPKEQPKKEETLKELEDELF